MKNQALFIAGAIAVLAFVFIQAAIPEDRLANSESGVATASMAVHAAFLEDGDLLADAHAKFEAASKSASLAPATIGSSFPTLSASTTTSPTCGSKLMTVEVDPVSGHKNGSGENFKIGGRFDFDVDDTASEDPLSGAMIKIYKRVGSGAVLVDSGTTNSFGDFDSIDLQAAEGDAFYVVTTKSGYCPVTSPDVIAGRPPVATTPPTTPPATPPPATTNSTTSSVTIPVSITGNVQTKNLLEQVSLEGNIVLRTAAGKTFNKTIPTVTIPQAGGTINGFGATYAFTKADIGTGRTSMTISIRASSVDLNNMPVSDAAEVTLYADTDYTGSIKISITPASFTSLSLGLDGQYGHHTAVYTAKDVGGG